MTSLSLDNRRFKPWTTLALATLLLVTALAATRHAAAQGTNNTLPDPVSSRELSRYADRLRLSPQQRQAVETLHDQYKEEFRALREGDIEKFLADARGLQRGGFAALFRDQKAIQQALKDYETLLNKVRAHDNRLFDAMLSVLTEEQSTLLPRVRQARDRVRYQSGLGMLMRFMNPAARVDLTEIALDLDLSAQQAQDLDPLFVSYESGLTSAAKRLHDESLSTLTDLLTQVQTLMADAMAGGRDGRGQVMETMRASLEEASLKLAERAAGVSDLNRRTLRMFESVLDAATARRYRAEYLHQAYPELGPVDNTAADRAFSLSLKLDDLQEEQRAQISAQAEGFRAEADRIIDQMTALVDDRRKSLTFTSFGGDSQRRFNESLDELRTRRNKLSETALVALRDALGPELSGRLDARLAEAPQAEGRAGAMQVSVMPARGGGGALNIGVRIDAERGDQLGRDPFLPAPISRRDLERYGRRLGLTDDNRSILYSLHDEYMEQFRELEQTTYKPVEEAAKQVQAGWPGNPGMPGGGARREANAEQPSPPTPQDIDSLYAKRRSAMEAVMALDSSFFDDVELTVGNEQTAPVIQRLRGARQRDVYAVAAERPMGMFAAFGGGGGRAARRFGSPGVMFSGGEETPLDLSALADDVRGQSHHAEFDALLAEYEAAATAAFRQLYDTAMRTQMAMDSMRASSARAGDDGRQMRAFGEGMRELMENDGRASRDARRAILTLNRSTMSKLESALGPAEAAALTREYNRRAYPGVFDDPRSAQPRFESAMALADLTPQQRTQVQELSLEYAGAYDELCLKMIELVKQSADAGGVPWGPGSGDWQALQERMRQREMLSFERNDLNDKALVRLRAALTPEQVAALGGLEPVEEPDAVRW